MSQESLERLARGTKTANGFRKPASRPGRREAVRPVLVRSGLYRAVEVQDALGVSDVSFAEWKRLGLETVTTPSGDMVVGGAVIDFLREHRAKAPRMRAAPAV